MSMPSFTAAALAGVPAGVQSQGVWMGRRQVFVRFAGEAETATMYSSDALARDLTRQAQRSVFHSVALSGRDPLANSEFLEAALTKAALALPVMLDTDGQRPDELARIMSFLTMVQVTLDPASSDSILERAMETLAQAAAAGRAHAFVAAASAETTDAQVLRVVEQITATSAATEIVLLPPPLTEPSLDRRWAELLEASMRLHVSVSLGARIPPPTGQR
jgi:organic radical activating enzyme